YSELATTPIYTDAAVLDMGTAWADAFNLHICEKNQVVDQSERQSGYYTSVGMIHSYNLDRMEVVTPTTEILAGPTNPLAALIATGNQAAGEVIDIAKEQELETPPYDIGDDGDSIETVSGAYVASTAEFSTVRFTAFLPAGLARITFGGPAAFSVRVVGKVLCKDMA
ncbi:hypothetical protein N8Z13_00670, partial [bacterium]|nr:hypothetical protein [bacterium]